MGARDQGPGAHAAHADMARGPRATGRSATTPRSRRSRWRWWCRGWMAGCRGEELRLLAVRKVVVPRLLRVLTVMGPRVRERRGPWRSSCHQARRRDRDGYAVDGFPAGRSSRGTRLITSATITSDGGPVGTRTAGDEAIALPRGMAVRVSGQVRIEVRRRTKTDYEQPFTARRSVLRFTTRTGRPRRVWTEAVPCGAPRTGRPAELLAVRPLLEPGASARIWLERTGAPQTVMGWFRDFDPAYARTYGYRAPPTCPSRPDCRGMPRAGWS